MKKMRWFFVLTALLGSISIAERCDAAVRPGAFTLSPFAGGYQFEGNQPLDDSPVYGLAIGYNFSSRWALELVANYIDAESSFDSGENIDAYAAHLDLLYHFRPREAFVPYIVAGLGANSFDPGEGDRDENLIFNLGVGFKYFLTDSVALRADVRGILDYDQDVQIFDWDHESNRERTTYKNLAYTGGLVFQFGGAAETMQETPLAEDTDHDGVTDQFDRCPDTAGGVVVDSYGCPQDRDEDGVPNFKDLCPGTPAGAKVDSRGCTTDTDKDGVPDGLDLCPDTEAGTAVDEKGCPKAVMADADGDGVSDEADKCPNTPKDIPVNSYGCPRDSDDDRVFDFEDKCPDTPAGTAVGPDGCPLSLEKALEEGPLTLRLEFESGESRVLPEFETDLEIAANYIKANPDSRILIEGHTDSIGSAPANLALSQARAESVRDYLVEHFGIDASRMEARGYGEERPVENNSTPEGRMQNRRVVITVVPGP